jgi:glutaredoxin/glutathione-dependent peroxiredoxin
MIAVGEKIPSARVVISDNAKEDSACARPKQVKTEELFKGIVILFAVPGAFTPTCHLQHLPGYLEHASSFFAKGVDSIYCMSTNDIFVMDAWGKQMKVGDKIRMLADGNGEFAALLGLLSDLTANLMGNVRTKRFAMIIKDGIVHHLGVGDLDLSGAEAILSKLN